jgi:hypothetical protein
MQTGAPTNNSWLGITSSADGQQLIAAGNAIFISTNYGLTWIEATEAPTNGNWGGVACSASGTILAGADFYSGIWLSHDSGASWNIQNLPTSGGWSAVAMSKDGNLIIAARVFAEAAGSFPPPPGLIYTSSDSGSTWLTNSLPAQNWWCTASSADGCVIVAAAHIYNFTYSKFGYSLSTLPGPFFTSTNYGSTWFTNNTPLEMWSLINCSADGRQWLAGTTTGLIYCSTNYGVVWNSNSPAFETNSCNGVSVSADGTKWLAAYSDGKIFFSTNQGVVWIEETSPTGNWVDITMSADENRWAGIGGNNIYTTYSTPNPNLNLGHNTNSAILSWTIPSTNFVLQQSSDLSTTNWSVVTNPPVLNLTNLQDQVTLPAPAASGFYRLKTP